MERTEILKRLKALISINGLIIGAAVGSGMTAKYTAMGGADFLLALSAGKYRMMGRSSYLSYFCYGNNNNIVMEMGTRELIPAIRKVPILFGLFANDPEIHLYGYLKEIRDRGFSGIVNFPTMALIDGRFREALEEENNTFSREVEAIQLAHLLDLFTIAFVTEEDEARQMLNAGADVICVHLGLTKGGFLGAKKYLSLEEARRLGQKIYQLCEELRPEVIRMIYAGPVNSPIDMQYFYRNTSCQGYIGGSTFDRIPVERAILETTRAFKDSGTLNDHDSMTKLLNVEWNTGDYVEFVKKYIAQHYETKICLGELALVTHISPSYLSTRFKKETGCSFTEYLVRFRVNKAKDLLRKTHLSFKEIAARVGYDDYAQFSKMFKKYAGVSPTTFSRDHINTRISKMKPWSSGR